MEILNGFLRTFSPFIPLRALGTIGPEYFHLEGGKLFWVRLLIGSGRVSPWTGIWPTYGTESRETLRDTGFDCYPVRGIRQLWARDAGLGKIFGIAMMKVRDARFSWKRIGNAGSGGPFGTLFYFPFACCSFISYAFSYSSRPSPGQKLPTHIVFVLPRLAVETVPSDSPSKFLGLQQSMQVRWWLGLGNSLPLQPGIDRCQS